MKNLFKIINRIWQIVLFLLIIIFSLYFLVSALMVMTTKGFAFTDWLISVLTTLSLAACVYLLYVLYKLHTHSMKWDSIHEERFKKEQELIDSLNENDPEWLTKRKLNLLKNQIKKGMKEVEQEKNEHDKIVM